MAVATIHGASCVAETDRALRVRIPYEGKRLKSGDGWREVWVPQSAVDDDSEVYGRGHEGKLVLKEWFAERLGLEID